MLDGKAANRPDTGQAARFGLWCGALGGAVVGLGDYGAMWLWLPLWRDRGSYLLRMVAAMVPAGALLGAISAAAGAALLARLTPRFGRRAASLWPLPFVLVSLPLLRLLALKLCSGGMMSRLPMRSLVEWALTLALPSALYAALWLGLRVGQAARRGQLPARALGLALLGGAFALGKGNQLVLPNLYDYLHAGLALLSWAAAALGWSALLGLDPLLERARRLLSPRRVALALGALLGASFVANALTLDSNLNVRVAMFDARSPASRALLAALDPALKALVGPRRPTLAKTTLVRDQVDVTGLPTRPGAHILLVTIDALRADHLGSYGYGRNTSPALDALARGAVRFERAYAQAPHSSYSLSSLHTSEYLHEVVELGRPLPEATLATTLAAAGYHTAAFFTDGIFHTEGQRLATYRDRAFGFALFDTTNYEAEKHTDRVLAEVERIKQQDEPPSLLWVHYFDVHEPYQETTFGSGDMDRYDSEILHVDRELARLIRELDARLEREVIVAITADHGEEFREHGGVYHGSTLFDEQVRVPLILRVPGLRAASVAQPVEVIDVAPTLLGAVGVAAPPSMRGRDLRALAEGRSSDVRPVFSAVLTKRMGLQWPHKIVADLRFGLYELYDLSRDPHERKNLASSEPERLNQMRALVYAWLDSLEANAGAERAEDVWDKALRWGRLGDRRAVEPMAKLLLDRTAPTPMRAEAGRILAKLADESSAPALVEGLDTEPFEVAAEAAIALGRMYDGRAQSHLRRLVHVEDPSLRVRAGVSLGRLRDAAAVPALIEALYAAPTQYEREEAVRWLGRLGDKRALEPLLGLLPEFSLRYLVTVALGLLGDERAFGALSEMLDWEHHTNIRDELVRGLGYLGDARSIARLVPVLAHEPGLKNTAESLVRLGAIEQGYLGGADVNARAKGLIGFSRCREAPLRHDWDYLERTTCTTHALRAQLTLGLPRKHASWDAGAQLVLRLRRDGAVEDLPVELSLQGRALAAIAVDGRWQEHRIEVPAALLGGAKAQLTLSAAAPGIVVDHALLVPRTGALAAAPSVAADAAHDAQRVP